MNPIKEDTKVHGTDDMEKKAGIRMASDVLHSLSKAIKALKLYPDNSPVRQKFITDLTAKFTRFLEEYGNLTLTVKPFDLLYEGEVVYNQPVKEDSIAFKLFGDGIREIVFSENLAEQEILNFIDVIQGKREQEEDEDEDDDIVTLMWKKDFRNIRYTVIEEGGESESGQEMKQPGTSASVAIRSGEALKSAHKAETEENQGRTDTVATSGVVELEIEQIYGKPFAEIFVLTPEEIENVKNEMEREAKSDLILELLDILFHILAIEEDTEGSKDTVKYIENAVQTMILTGDYEHAIEALTRIRNISGYEKEISERYSAAAAGLIDALGCEDFLMQLTRSLNTIKTENIDGLFTILSMLDKNAILPLTNMLGSLEQMKPRRLVCDALAVIAKDNIDMLLKKLQDDNWHIVRNIVYVLGRIGDTRVTSHIKRIRDHKEPRVRKEIIHTLSEIKSEEAKNLLISYLSDGDGAVRISALKRLVTMGHRNAVQNILDIISSEGFEDKENYEKKELFEALAVLGAKEQIPYLKELLTRKSWLFGRTKADELRVLAVYALKKMDTAEATDILRGGASSSDKTIKKICEDALKSSGKGNI